MSSHHIKLTDYAVDSMIQTDAATPKRHSHLLAFLVAMIVAAFGWGLC